MDSWTIQLDPAMRELLEEMVQDLGDKNIPEEQRMAYNYFLRKFVGDLVDDRYTINK